MRTAIDPTDLGACDNCGKDCAACSSCGHRPHEHDETGFCRACGEDIDKHDRCWDAAAGERASWTAPDIQVWKRESRSYYEPPDYSEKQLCDDCVDLDFEGAPEYDPTDDAELRHERRVLTNEDDDPI